MDHRALIQQMLDVFDGMEQNYGNLWQMNLTPEGLDLLCTAAREYLAAPEQSEPVMIRDIVVHADYRELWLEQLDMNQHLTAALSAPQPTELTNHEVADIYATHVPLMSYEDHFDFAMAVLAAQKAKV